jgi:nucleoside-diphosphate-sugar epimerase
MRLLVLGGTSFLGRHLVNAALARGHSVTLFNRGRTNPGLWPRVKELRGDRDSDLGALQGHSWDAVVDTSGYVPRVVRASAELLVEDVPHYTFISTISVYADFRRSWDEAAPVSELAEPASEDVHHHYGALKAVCERVVEEIFPTRSLIVRPGLIVGPWDPTGRFTYWAMRIALGGDVLAPEPRDLRVQFIDARDLADWIVRQAEEGAVGLFNATGPVPRPTLEELLETCRRTANPRARLHWVGADFLREREVGELQEVPFWLVDPDLAGFMNVDASKAMEAGLAFRSIEETVRDTVAWARDHPGWEPPYMHGVQPAPAGMDPKREAELLAEWKA